MIGDADTERRLPIDRVGHPEARHVGRQDLVAPGERRHDPEPVRRASARAMDQDERLPAPRFQMMDSPTAEIRPYTLRPHLADIEETPHRLLHTPPPLRPRRHPFPAPPQ